VASLCGSPCTLLLLSGFCRDQEKSLDKDILNGTMPGTRLATCSISVVMTVVPPKWARSESRDPFLHFGAPFVFGVDEARHFKLGLQIERKQFYHYAC